MLFFTPNNADLLGFTFLLVGCLVFSGALLLILGLALVFVLKIVVYQTSFSGLFGQEIDLLYCKWDKATTYNFTLNHKFFSQHQILTLIKTIWSSMV